MKAFVTLFLVLVLALASPNFAQESENCDDELALCGPDDPAVCLLHPRMLCFAKFTNICIYNQMKCLFNLDYKIYDLEYCELENFLCRPPDHEHQGGEDNLN